MVRITQEEENKITDAERARVDKETARLGDAEVIALHKAHPPTWEILSDKPTMEDSRAQVEDQARRNAYHKVWHGRYVAQAKAIREALESKDYDALTSEQGRAAINAQFKDVIAVWGEKILSDSLHTCLEQPYDAMVGKRAKVVLEAMRTSTAGMSAEDTERCLLTAVGDAQEYANEHIRTRQHGILLTFSTSTGDHKKYLKFPTVEKAAECSALATLVTERYDAQLHKQHDDAARLKKKVKELRPTLDAALNELPLICGPRAIRQAGDFLKRSYSYTLNEQGNLQLKTSEMWIVLGQMTEARAKPIADMWVALNLTTPQQIEKLFSEVAFVEPKPGSQDKSGAIKGIIDAGPSANDHSVALPTHRMRNITDRHADDGDHGEDHGNGWERFAPRGGNGGLGF